MTRLALLVLSALVAGPAWAESVRELSRVVWRDGDERFGGLSGMVLSADGREVIAVSDRGTLFRATLTRDGDRLTGVTGTEAAGLRTPLGTDLGRFAIDGEGMAPAPDGGFFISFEAKHRVRYYPGFGQKARPRPAHPQFAGLQNNSGLEALAADRDGTLYAIPERSGRLDRPFPVYRFDGQRWDIPFTVPRRPPHLPVGAEIGPDGRLYLLERDFQMLGGFATRLRRFDMGETLTGEVTLLDTPRGALDNMESLAMWVTEAGELRLLMLSDDNFSVFQRTLLVEYAVETNLSN